MVLAGTMILEVVRLPRISVSATNMIRTSIGFAIILALQGVLVFSRIWFGRECPAEVSLCYDASRLLPVIGNERAVRRWTIRLGRIETSLQW